MTFPSPAPSAEARALVQQARRLAWLRLHGEEAAALALEAGAFTQAVQALAAVDAPAAHPEAVARIVAAEEHRAAEAAVLAEILAPQLAAQLQALGSFPRPVSAAAPARAGVSVPVPAPEFAVAATTSSAGRSPRAAAGTSASIADFIDDMFAEERRAD